MFTCLSTLTLLVNIIYEVKGQLDCQISCPKINDNDSMTCGFIAKENTYKMFPSQCAFEKYKRCYSRDISETPLHFCIKADSPARKMYGESCPVFCPSHYRPICGANRMRSYLYKTFINGCYLDIINCRGGEDEYSEYIEVPLEFCQRHSMKNIFKEQIVMTNFNDYQEID